MRKYRLTLLFSEINSRIILLNQELTYLCENVVDENRKLSFHNIRKRAESIYKEVFVLSNRAQMIYMMLHTAKVHILVLVTSYKYLV